MSAIPGMVCDDASRGWLLSYYVVHTPLLSAYSTEEHAVSPKSELSLIRT